MDFKKLLFTLLSLSLGLSLPLNALDLSKIELTIAEKGATEQSISKTILNHAKYTAQEAAKAYALAGLTTLGHEMGHAISRYTLTGVPSKVYVGGYPDLTLPL
jgi:hypothetical protein